MESRDPAPKYARTFSCPSCGGSLEIKAPGHTITVACQYCSSLIDVNTPEYKVLAAQQAALKPSLPLGTRMDWDGKTWELIGFMQKRDVEWHFSWEELLLYNPRYGFRWLSQYQGHYMLLAPIHGQYELSQRGAEVRWRGLAYRKYHQGRCEVEYVLGEFYWRAQVGDRLGFAEYVAPPYFLSLEADRTEQAWTIGRYVSHRQLQEALKPHVQGQLPALPATRGTAPAQPNPYKKSARAMRWTLLLGLAALVVVQVMTSSRARRKEVLKLTYETGTMQQDIGHANATYDTTRTLISPPFVLKGGVDNVEATTLTNLNNSWIEIDYTLVNEETGETFPLLHSLEYYSGVSGGESWSEGSRETSSLLNAIPEGTYHLEAQAILPPGATGHAWQVVLTRGVVSTANFFIVLALLLIPFGWISLLSYWFEKKRWAESDYSPFSN
ncbi:MAG: DUF4178 domain-containing protein [Sphingobacteriia bacterium]